MLCSGHIAEESRPLSMFESKSLKEVFDYCTSGGYTGPCRQTVKSRLIDHKGVTI